MQTQKQAQQLKIINALIARYTQALAEVRKQPNLDEAHACCVAFGVESGVCTAMGVMAKSSQEMVDNHCLMHDLIAKYRDTNSRWWAIIPGRCRSKAEVVASLEYRLETLLEINISLTPQSYSGLAAAITRNL